MSVRQPTSNRQFLTSLIAAFKIDGSDVTTTYAKTGLLKGLYIGTVKKGAAADSNLVTLRLNNPLGLAPFVLIQPVTLNCVPREESVGVQEIAIRTLQSDYATKADDCDMVVYLFGTEGIREGSY